jgi:DnaJ-class molecular chaperone
MGTKRTWITCSTCNGTGSVPHRGVPITCSRCGGIGGWYIEEEDDEEDL